MSGDGPDAGGQVTGLLRAAYLLTGDRAAAEDLLLAVLVAAGPGTGDRRRLVAEHLRRSRRQVVGEATAAFSWPGATQPAAPGPGPVAAALARLPPRTRAVLVLRYGEDLPDEVVGPAVGRPAAAVAGLTDQGLTRLGELLGEPDVEAALRRDLSRRAAEVDGAAPAGLLDRVAADRRAQRSHRAGLVALAVLGAAVVLLVLLTVG
ncbi:sigma factor-like helix-turn-helix DNA-binding protein [Modestobacter marinus]|uniref:sigma factor-like helix-turn-helix DNA-binding protein n=1 Tax=Modestobacter marinus TaxID=477641 RepID=UPI001C97CE02|nr:sigma factor-like helix-turn-helix DNA-binding protein [Modestobacter marinus]